MTQGDQIDYPIPPVDAIEPPPEWEQLRQQCPVAHVRLPSGDQAALLTRYDDVRQVLSDPRFARTGDGAARVSAEGAGAPPPSGFLSSSTVLSRSAAQGARGSESRAPLAAHYGPSEANFFVNTTGDRLAPIDARTKSAAWRSLVVRRSRITSRISRLNRS